MSRVPTTVPGPLRRLLRERGRALAVALVAASALAVAGLQSGAATALRASLDENWRGAYDILVVPADARGAITGMLPPNSLAGGASGITLDELARVRGVEGVGLAAPIGEIVVPTLKPVFPAIAIPPGTVGAEEAPQAFRVRATYTTDDGLGERVVTTSSSDIVVEESFAADSAPECRTGDAIFNELKVDPERYPALSEVLTCGFQQGDGVYSTQGDGWAYQGADNGVLVVALQGAPQGASRITLVDPVAERELLGEAGAFLDPLVAVAPDSDLTITDMLDWARADTGVFGQDFLDDQVEEAGFGDFYGDAALADVRRLYADNGLDFEAEMAAQRLDASYLPLLVANAPSARLSIKVTIESFGDAVSSRDSTSGPRYSFPSSMAGDEPGDPVGTVVADISGALNPLVDGGARIAWPGVELDAAELLPEFNSLGVTAVARPLDGHFTRSGNGVALEPTGYRDPLVTPFELGADPFRLDADAATPGSESAYLGLEQRFLAGTDAMPPLAVPIGSFSAEAVDADEASYVPLGAYAPVDSTITGGDRDGTTMRPSVTGLGLVSPRTIAIGSLASAGTWGDPAPIGAIRVRVAGIDGYSPAAQQKVVDVATRVQQLGLRAIVVAGSSPSPVEVQVGGYAFGVDTPDAAQDIGPLGTITQLWSELGAAARAELAISGATVAIAVIGVGASIVLLGAVQLAAIPGRRQQSGALREIGFTRRRTARWIAAEELPGVAVIVAVAVGAALPSGSALTAIVLTLVAAATLVLGAVAVTVGARPASPGRMRVRRSRRKGVRSVGAFGARQAWLHPVTSLTQLVAVVIVGAASAALVAVFLRGRAEAGQSVLASLLGDQQLLPQLALGVTAIAAGVALALLGRRLELGRRTAQWSTLRSSGWTSRQIARAQRAESAAIVVPALMLAVGTSAVGILLLELPQPGVLIAVAAGAAGAAAAVTLTARTRGTRP